MADQNNPVDKILNTTDYTQQYHPQDIADGKVMSILAYIWILFFLPLVGCPQSRFGRFHANQGLLVLICGVIVGLISTILGLILPVLGAIIGGILGLVNLVFVILGILNAAQGRAKELPLIGSIRFIK